MRVTVIQMQAATMVIFFINFRQVYASRRWYEGEWSFSMLKEQIEDTTTSLLVQIDNRIRILVMLQILRLNISYQLYVITKISAIISRYFTAKFEQ